MARRIAGLAGFAVAATSAGLYNAFVRRIVPLPEAHPSTDFYEDAWPAMRGFLLEGQGLPHIASLTADSIKPASIQAWYRSQDPLQSGMAATFWLSIVVWLLGEASGNSSVVDRIWTIVPVVASAHFTFYPHLIGGVKAKAFAASSKLAQTDIPGVSSAIDQRMLLVFLLQCCWSARLTYNGARRGFYSNLTEEDYRWPILRQRMSKPLYKLLNLTFIAFIQCYLLFFTALPQYMLLTMSKVYHPTWAQVPLGTPDVVLAVAFLATLGIEMISDNQQQAYQNFKRSNDPVKLTPQQEADKKRGFVTSGLWAWSRHPNFACEQTTWWILYLFTVRASLPASIAKTLASTFSAAVKARDVEALKAVALAARPYFVNYSVAGALSMTILFIASTIFTEGLSAEKYPLYKSYQSRVAMFLPIETILIKTPLAFILGKKSKLDRDVYGIADTPADKGQKAQ